MTKYIYKENNGEFEINIEGLEDIRPIRKLPTEALAKMWIEDMIKSEELGWEHGSQLGYKINELEFDELEFAVLRAVFGGISNTQTLELISKRIKLESSFDGDEKLIEFLKESFNSNRDDEDFFYSIYNKFNAKETN